MVRVCRSSRGMLVFYNLNWNRTLLVRRTMSIRLFEDKEHATSYSQYRPTYPDAVYRTIKEYCEKIKGKECDFQLAVDVGCGNGQSTLPLLKTFRHVIGYDVSDQQIASAPKEVENLTFKVGPGEDLKFLDNDSVDLVTVAQALHWLDLETFYEEVRRVVKEEGVFAAYGYGNNVLDNEEAQRAMKEFYGDLLGQYWDKQRRHVEDCYIHLGHPFKEWERIENEDISIRRSMPVDAYIGYLSTWSAWRSYLKAHPSTDALDVLRANATLRRGWLPNTINRRLILLSSLKFICVHRYMKLKFKD